MDTLTESSEFIHDPDGIDDAKLEWMKDLKVVRRGRTYEYADQFGCEFCEGKPWGGCELAIPCATQNELDVADAVLLIQNEYMAVFEGATMPTTVEAIDLVADAKVLYGPGKAFDAGGVAVLGLEMTQNSIRLARTAGELKSRLQQVMVSIHRQRVQCGQEDDHVNYVRGANVAGFIKVAIPMLAYGVA